MSAVDRRRYTREFRKRFPETAGIQQLTALGVDRGGRIVQAYRISAGALNECFVKPEQVFGPAARLGKVAGIVLVSSHPTGRLAPTGVDLVKTRQLRREGDLCGVKLLDHVLVGPRRRAVSLREAAR